MELHSSNVKPKSNAWVPVEGVTTHEDNQIRDNVDFFAAPPAVIGKILTADSELKQGEKLWSRRKKYLVAVAIGISSSVAIYGLFYICIPEKNAIVSLIFGGVLFMCALVVAKESKKECSYVSTCGVARYRLPGNINEGLLIDVLQFDNVRDLYTDQEDHYRDFEEGGGYSNTSYTYRWKNANSKKCIKLEGSYQEKGGFPGNLWDSPGRYAFALSAESAWNKYKLNELQCELDTSGYIDFTLSSDLTVRVGPEYAELRWPNETRRLTSSDFRQITFLKKKTYVRVSRRESD